MPVNSPRLCVLALALAAFVVAVASPSGGAGDRETRPTTTPATRPAVPVRCAVIGGMMETDFWPALAKLGLGRLPGDLAFRRGGFTLYLPLATSLIASLVLSVILWLIRR